MYEEKDNDFTAVSFNLIFACSKTCFLVIKSVNANLGVEILTSSLFLHRKFITGSLTFFVEI